MSKKEFQEVVEITRKVVSEFEKREQKKWGIEGATIELGKQLGDLCKLVMAQEKYYLRERDSDPTYKTNKDKIGDELSDIWFCMVRIADYYQIDLEEALVEARKRDEAWFDEHPQSKKLVAA